MGRRLTIALFVFLWGTSSSQVVLERVLVGAASIDFDNGQFSLSSSVGEAMVSTESQAGLVLTQGFQQSNYVLNNPLIVELEATNAACIGANDGTVAITFISENITEPRTYQWSTGASTEELVQVEAGIYSVTVTGADGNQVVNAAEVGANSPENCAPGFYIGITPNNDNFNDYWHIDNAAFFERKEVEIFNRYGAAVWKTDDYSNTNGERRFTGLHRNGNPLPDGTYYFVARFDDSRYNGWIEITR